jgi:phage-related minor tail protein
LDIKFPKFQNPFPKIKKSVDQLIPKIIEYSEVEEGVTNTVKDQLDAKNNIVPVTQNIKTGVEQLTEAERNAKREAQELKDTFMEIGKSVEDGVVQGLTDAVMGTKSLAEAATGVLNNLKRKLVEVAMQRAVSGLGNAVGGFLGNVFGGGKKSGGGGIGGFLGGLFGKERGGPVSAGGAYVVGERGPEILQMGSKGGNIVPNRGIGGTVNNVTVNVDASGMSGGGGSDVGQLGEMIAGVVQQKIIEEQRAGGLLNR